MDGDIAYTRILLKDGIELDRIGPINYAGRSLADPINLYGYLSGSDYQVKIELYSMDSDGEPLLVSSATSDFFNLQNHDDTVINCNYQHPLVVYAPVGKRIGTERGCPSSGAIILRSQTRNCGFVWFAIRLPEEGYGRSPRVPGRLRVAPSVTLIRTATSI